MTTKKKDRVAAIFVCAAVCLCLCAVCFPGAVSAEGSGVTMEYEEKLFQTGEPIQIDLLLDESDWDAMLQNAIAEEYVKCDVTVNGETFYQVGVRPKGNTSLSSIANDPTTDRYSLKLEFDQYVTGQTCFGLDKLVLNNHYADATYMKEALVYDMYRFLGADASLCNYAVVSVNGEYWGLYLALEAVEDSFQLRNYGVESGRLYKPEGVGGGREMGAQGSGGADLNYTDDELSSYETIWDGALQSVTKADKQRVVAALQHAAEGTELEQYLDVDNLLRYMAVHAFAVNEDSLSGSMAHNYYLYEQNGRLNLLPWDYNLALGGMGMGSASAVINDDVEDPFSGTDFFDALLENEEYRAQYHEYLTKLCEEYVQGGGAEAFFKQTREQIDELVQTDPTAFYSYEEYETAVETLQEAVALRSEAVESQLSGSSEQVGVGELDLSVMGAMNMGGPGENGDNAFGGQFQGGAGQNGAPPEQGEFSPPDQPGGADPTENGNAPPEMPDGETPPDQAESGADQAAGETDEAQGGNADGENSGEQSNAPPQMPDGEAPQGARPQMPAGGFDAAPSDWGERFQQNAAMPMGEASQSAAGASMETLALYGGCGVLLIAALIFVKCYRRKNIPAVSKKKK